MSRTSHCYCVTGLIVLASLLLAGCPAPNPAEARLSAGVFNVLDNAAAFVEPAETDEALDAVLPVAEAADLDGCWGRYADSEGAQVVEFFTFDAATGALRLDTLAINTAGGQELTLIARGTFSVIAEGEVLLRFTEFFIGAARGGVVPPVQGAPADETTATATLNGPWLILQSPAQEGQELLEDWYRSIDCPQ
jgi:hypothetical protein